MVSNTTGDRSSVLATAIDELRQQRGRMRELGSEDGVPKLDWVEGVARLLADSHGLEEIEAEARDIRQRGIRHLIWSGMGGSVEVVRVLVGLGFCNGAEEGSIVIHPLDSTDPAALNVIVSRIVADKGLLLPKLATEPSRDFLRELLADVMMVGVSMGMTSEEPITHLTWFTALLERAELEPARHLLIMALPGSYLDTFAHDHAVPSRPLQLDGGTGTGGRMSAPATRVFLLPTALALREAATLRSVLQTAWQKYDLELATAHPLEHQFVRLAVALDQAAVAGGVRLLLQLPRRWQALLPWIEQLMEESLGKGGKGIVVFDDQLLSEDAPCFSPGGMLRVHLSAKGEEDDDAFHLIQPDLAAREPAEMLVALVSSLLGWQLTMALFGYLQNITFAGQPAVEDYKSRARRLREEDDPLEAVLASGLASHEGQLTVIGPPGLDAAGPESLLSQALLTARPLYLDLTMNGEWPAGWESPAQSRMRALANERLGIPVKIRRAPAAYHATEQSEMDGPRGLVSLRLVRSRNERIVLGTYTDRFLLAQAAGTWQSMVEQGRTCLLLVLDGTTEEGAVMLDRVLTGVAAAFPVAHPENPADD
jgi:hypothetical protein